MPKGVRMLEAARSLLERYAIAVAVTVPAAVRGKTAGEDLFDMLAGEQKAGIPLRRVA